MILSDKYKYVFLETPHTGSTAISKELRKNYDGKEVLNKHANYHEFLRVASTAQKKYFVFAGVRNPLDEAYSLYYKFLTNHKSNYTDPNKLLENGGWVTQRKINIYKLVQSEKDFEKFLEHFYRRTYTSNIDINKKSCDYILRFENLDEDFGEALKQLGVKRKRRLPEVNKTSKKGDFGNNYDTNARKYAVKIFGPFMENWDYAFPKSWEDTEVSFYARASYRFGVLGRSIYSKYMKTGPLEITKIRNILE